MVAEDALMWYLFVAVRAEYVEQAAVAAAIVWPGEPAGSQQLTVALVDAEGNPWMAGNSLCTDEEIYTLQTSGFAEIPDVRWCRYERGGDRLLAQAWPTGPELGVPWGPSQCMAAAGLSQPPSIANSMAAQAIAEERR